jgi:glycosyltransferase involved in cell wall biosynthesis
MRIAIDYTPAIAQSAGIGRYTSDLVRALARVDPTDRFTLFSSEPPTKERAFPAAPNLQPHLVGLGNRRLTIAWHRLRLPIPAELLMGNADVIHGPDFSLPPALHARRVVTVHDLAFLTHPECALPSLVTYLNRVVPRAIRAADRVIAVSQRTADDLIERLGVPREKMRVIHLGIAPAFSVRCDPEQLAAVCRSYALERPFVLAVSTIEPRKNYERLIASFAQATRAPGGPRMLVIVGRKGWLYDGVFAAVAMHGVADRVRFLDYLPDDELVALYQAAAAVAVPSLYEGFGIPVLEAMASGTPVVCSTGGSLPEIAGDAALLVDPEDVDGLASALVQLVTDEGSRSSLRERGLRRASGFTWDAAARAHVAVYHEAAGEPMPPSGTDPAAVTPQPAHPSAP